MPEEQDIHSDHDGDQREHIRHDGGLPSHRLLLLGRTGLGKRGGRIAASREADGDVQTARGHPSTIYVKAATSRVRAVDGLLAAQANPQNPAYVKVSQPSAALTAQAAAKGAFSTLFLGLGAVALLVGAIGVANIMVISVLERRSEIGLRRALGATKGHIRVQFLSEAVFLAGVGGIVGVASGAAATAIYARHKACATVIPPDAWAGGICAAMIIGALAGLLPAIRAARLSPTEALWSF